MIEKKRQRALGTHVPPVVDPLKVVPSLGKGMGPGSDIFLGVSPKRTSSVNSDIAKVRFIFLFTFKVCLYRHVYGLNPFL